MGQEHQSPRRSPKRSLVEAGWAFGVFFALAVVLYSPALLGGEILLLRDLHSQFYGSRWWYRESLLAGEVPHWNPYVACGTPFLANPQNSVLYPGNLLFLVFPTAYAFALHAALHQALLGLFSWLLGRALGLSFWAAMLAGLMTAFAGMPVKLAEFPEEIAGFAWTPLILFGAWKCMTDSTRRAAAVLGLAIGMQLLAGCPYPPLYSGLGIACVILAVAFGGRRREGVVHAGWARPLGGLALGMLIGGLIGAAQYVPTLLLVQGTPREALAGIMPPMFSLRLRDALHGISPWLTGYPDWQKCFYFGVTGLLLGIGGAAARLWPGRSAPTDMVSARLGRSTTWLCFLMIGAGWVFAQAGYLGLDRVVSALPLVSRTMKWPTLGMTLVIAGMAILAGRGLDAWMQSSGSGRRRYVLPGLVAGVGVVLAVDWFRGGNWFGTLRVLLQEPLLPMKSASAQPEDFPVAAEPGRIALFVLLFAGVLVLGMRGWRVRAIGPMACLVVALELLTAWRGINFYSRTNVYLEEPASEAWRLQSSIPARRGIGADLPGRLAVPVDFIAFNDLAYGSRDPGEFQFLRNLCVGNAVMNLGAFTTQGLGSVPLNDYAWRLQPVLDELAAQRTEAADRVLGAWNVSVILEGDLTADGQVRFGSRANSHVLPRARLVDRVDRVTSEQQALERLSREEWNPNSVMLYVESPSLALALERFAADGSDAGTVADVRYRPNEIHISCEVVRPSLLVLAENWARGWSARVNDAPAEVHRVNFLQQAVVLPPGRHEVIWRYRTPGYWIGLVSGGAGVLLGVVCWRPPIRAVSRTRASGRRRADEARQKG